MQYRMTGNSGIRTIANITITASSQRRDDTGPSLSRSEYTARCIFRRNTRKRTSRGIPVRKVIMNDTIALFSLPRAAAGTGSSNKRAQHRKPRRKE